MHAKRGLEIVERHIKPEELAEFSECFITGTAAEVTPVSEIGPYSFVPGQISQQMIADYMEEVQPAAAQVQMAASL